MNAQKVKITELQPHPDNYNQHPESQLVELEKSLSLFEEHFDNGQFKNIIVCQGKILAGHGLVEAAKRQGREYIYAVVNDDLPEDVQRALIVADNATPAGALPDVQKLEAIFEKMPEFEIPGCTQEWLHSVRVMQSTDVDIDQFFIEDQGSEQEKQPATVECPHCGESFEV